MFGRHGTVWQVGLAALGLIIVGFVLLGPRGQGTTPLIAAPAGQLGSNGARAALPASQAVVQQPPADQSGQQAAASGDPGTGSAAGAATGSAALPALPALPAVAAVPAAPALSTAGRTLFLDNFAGDPLGPGLPAGWLLADPTSSSSGLGGLPILGGLLGGLTSSGASPVPSVVNDGTHVLSRTAGSWSHLAAGPVTADSTASADVKMLSGSSGFVGIAGRLVDASNMVGCGLRNGTVLQLWQLVDGRQQLLASSPVTAAMNVFHTIRMQLEGGQLTCSLDGADLLHATGSWTSPGHIGLVALGDVTSEFDNVVSTALP